VSRRPSASRARNVPRPRSEDLRRAPLLALHASSHLTRGARAHETRGLESPPIRLRRARLDLRAQRSEEPWPLRSGAVPTDAPKSPREPTPGPASLPARRRSTTRAQKGPHDSTHSKNRGPRSTRPPRPAPKSSPELRRRPSRPLDDRAANRSASEETFESPRPETASASPRPSVGSEEPPSSCRSAPLAPGPRVSRALPPRRP